MPMPMPGSYIRSFFLVLIPGVNENYPSNKNRSILAGSYSAGRTLSDDDDDDDRFDGDGATKHFEMMDFVETIDSV